TVSDQDLRGLGVQHVFPISPSSSTDVVKPTTFYGPIINEEQLLKKNNLISILSSECIRLIHWKIPGRSAIVFGSILFLLILTSYHSLLYLLAGGLTTLIGFNLAFVNIYNWTRSLWTGFPVNRLQHPFHMHMNQTSLSIRTAMEHTIPVFMDILEIMAQKSAKVIYVEDTNTTAQVCLISAFVYMIAGIVPIKMLFGLFIVGVFTMPYGYERHRGCIEQQIKTYRAQFIMAMNRYDQVSRERLYAMFAFSLDNDLKVHVKDMFKRLDALIPDSNSKESMLKEH
ncbi:hypothetical protein CU098_010590, partial [Rhizopus stolonifer]